jgi:hypothetical protein
MKTMKIKFSTIFFLLLLVIVSSCKKAFDDKLNVTPRDRLTDASVWTDQGTADVFLNDVYGKLPDGNNSYDPFDNWSDNSICGYAWPASRNLAQEASYTPSTLDLSQSLPLGWSTLFSNIRKTNVFIKNVTASALPDDFKKQRLAEAKFLRAYFYHLVWICYGGAPIITEPLDVSTQGENIFKEKATFDETYAFIISDLVDAANDLGTTNDAGRATKGAALTLKGWCELFAHKYTDAAATNKTIIETMGNGIIYDLFSNYGTLFLPEGNNNKEGIFYRQYIPRVIGGRNEGYNGTTFTKGGAETSWGGVNPTQELIDDYSMDNGLPITDPASGYNPQKPYKNRELRFYESIVYDGSYWYNDTIYTRQGIGSPNEIDLSDKNDGTQTGYYLRKGCNDKITLGSDNWDGASGGQNFYFFRYAEVLLNYAEAQNEAVGPDASVYDAIDKIRARAALPALSAGFSQTQMRTAIRRERRIELAFENKRWWDLIRWRTAEINLNLPEHGISIEAGPGGTLIYAPVPAVGGTRKFDASKNYLFPIPQGAIDQNTKLVQNPGYN